MKLPIQTDSNIEDSCITVNLDLDILHFQALDNLLGGALLGGKSLLKP
ncbi:hypothetical protein AVDCRST_MAG81-1882 [uncultured Synechococcales cyanobacterium]|uniref:Uncharacterized protein n=1 Tax=uncultured Synechococcales cyanobacterium TaxID=1936017 RepID=A0A6J4UJ20_9CYAN|nr:hypothetical protein AVDCRST_MAG81-1882 [uncultured Synechococcales cyanobacterium]